MKEGQKRMEEEDGKDNKGEKEKKDEAEGWQR